MNRASFEHRLDQALQAFLNEHGISFPCFRCNDCGDYFVGFPCSCEPDFDEVSEEEVLEMLTDELRAQDAAAEDAYWEQRIDEEREK